MSLCSTCRGDAEPDGQCESCYMEYNGYAREPEYESKECLACHHTHFLYEDACPKFQGNNEGCPCKKNITDNLVYVEYLAEKERGII